MSGQVPIFESLNIEQLRNPVWLYDIQQGQIHWANQSALELWEAVSLAELTQRHFSSTASAAVQQTLHGYLMEFALGKVIDSWWQISPKG